MEEKCLHTTQLNSTKGYPMLDEGFENILTNSHKVGIVSQTVDSPAAALSNNLVDISPDPLNESFCVDGNTGPSAKVEFVSVDDVCESVTVETTGAAERMELGNAFSQHCMNFLRVDTGYGYFNGDTGAQEVKPNGVLDFPTQTWNFSSKESSVIGAASLASEIKNFDVGISRETKCIPENPFEDLSGNEIEKRCLDTHFKGDLCNTAEMSLTNIAQSPIDFNACYVNEVEVYDFKNDATAKTSNTEMEISEILCQLPSTSRSSPLRESCNSQLSESPISTISSTKTSSSSDILGGFSRNDSSSPLLKRKKRKRNIFQDTDCEEELQSSDPEEKSSRNTNKKPFFHQTYVSDDEGPYPAESRTSKCKLSDFEMMMQQKRAERQKTRKRGSDFITSNDDLIDQLIDRMEEAAYEDRQLNKKGLPATKKVSMLKYVVSQLRKKDLQSIFLEHNILGTLTEWLSPLPTRCLPCLQIRESIIRLLDDFPRIETSLLRHSGIGRMLKFLRDHPDETKENQERCNRLIAKWTRPILDTSCEYKAMSKKERQERDYELSLRYAKQKKKAPKNCKKVSPNILDIALSSSKSTEASRPGEPGWIPRARVPQPSVRDYIKRPESKLSCEIFTKMPPNRFEILSKKYQKARGNKLFQRSGAKLSIVGDKMT